MLLLCAGMVRPGRHLPRRQCPLRLSATGEVIIPCAPEVFMPTVEHFSALQDGRGSDIFSIAEVSPADDPCEILLEGAGLGLRFTRHDSAAPSEASFRVTLPDVPAGELHSVSPCGAAVTFVPLAPSAAWRDAEYPDRHLPVPLSLPALLAPAPVISRRSEDGFGSGRAGMLYRDLVPCRLGGAMI
eukprot:2404260-Prymnesium_polylepis.1